MSLHDLETNELILNIITKWGVVFNCMRLNFPGMSALQNRFVTPHVCSSRKRLLNFTKQKQCSSQQGASKPRALSLLKADHMSLKLYSCFFLSHHLAVVCGEKMQNGADPYGPGAQGWTQRDMG